MILQIFGPYGEIGEMGIMLIGAAGNEAGCASPRRRLGGAAPPALLSWLQGQDSWKSHKFQKSNGGRLPRVPAMILTLRRAESFLFQDRQPQAGGRWCGIIGPADGRLLQP